MGRFTVKGGSDLTVTLRTFDVTDENMVNNSETARGGSHKTALLNAATLEIEDPGPYDAPNGKLDWGNVLHGDREIILLRASIETWGGDYLRRDPCPGCNLPGKNWFNLSEFPVKALPALSVDHVKNGTPLECLLPKAKKKVQFRLRRGKDEKDLRRIANYRPDKLASELYKLTVLGVEGVSGEKISDFLEHMEGMDSSYLRFVMDEADTGIEQEGVWRCDCGHRWVKDVELGKDFFFPDWRARTRPN